jgi:hypothetical protein
MFFSYFVLLSHAADLSALKPPTRGALNLKPAATWDDGLLIGNGNFGAIVMGQPLDETVILSHGRLFMPWEKPLPPVNTGAQLKEIRRLLIEGEYQQAADLVVTLSKNEGYERKRWTDPLIPAFDLKISMEQAGEVRGYGRTLDFTNGTASVRWEDDRGAFLRRMFVSRPDGEIFNRVRLDLGGGEDRNLALEELAAKSKIGNLNRALLEKEFDKGRYVVLSASGDWPPALQGIWTGTWGPPTFTTITGCTRGIKVSSRTAPCRS